MANPFKRSAKKTDTDSSIVRIGDSSIPGVNTHATWGMKIVDPGIPLRVYDGHMHNRFSPERIWKTQPSVRKVLTYIARAVGFVPWRVYLANPDNGRERLWDSPAETAIRKPRRFLTGKQLIEQFVIDFLMHDSALIILDINGAPMRVKHGLYSVDTDLFGNVQKVYLHAKDTGNKSKVDITDAPMALLRGWDEHDGLGISPLRTIAALLEEQERSVAWRSQQWQGTPKITGVLERPLEAPPWSKEASERFRKDWEEYKYSAEAKTPLLEDGMKYVPQQQTLDPVKAQDIQGRQLTDAEVASYYGVPPELVGARAGNYGSVQQFKQMLYGPVLGPLIEHIEAAFNAELVPALDARDGVYGIFDRKAVQAGSFIETVQAITSATGAPVLSRAEGRAELDLPYIDGTEELIVPLNVLEGGQASPYDSGSQNRDPENWFTPAEPLEKKDKTKGWTVKFCAGAQEPADKYIKEMERLTRRMAKATEDGEIPSEEDWVEKWGTIGAKIIEPHLLDAAQTAIDDLEENLETNKSLKKAAGIDSMKAYLAKAARTDANAVATGTRNTIVRHVAEETLEEIPKEALSLPNPAETGDLLDALAARAREFVQSTWQETYSWAGNDAAEQQGATFKEWQVTSSNPRPSHAAINMTQVDIDDIFPNGLRYPHDWQNGDTDECAHCQCEVLYGATY